MVYGILSALPMLVCLFWTVTLLVGFRRGDRAKRLLALFMGVAMVLYFCHWVYFNRALEMIPATDTIYALCTLSVYPLCFLYIKLLTESSKLTLREIWIFLPAALSCVACGVLYALMSEGERMEFVERVVFERTDAATVSPLAMAQHVRFRLAGVVFAVQVGHTLWLGSRKIARYNREIANYYSHTEGRTLSEVRTMLLFFVATSLASFVMNIVGRGHFVGSVWMILIPSLLFSTLLYALGYIGQNNKFTVLDFAREAEGDEPHDTAAQPDNLAVGVKELVESRELYRQPDIKISDVARLLNTNRTYISTALNRDLGVSFSEMMNRYRVEHAMRLIADSAAGKNPYSTIEIIEMSGFSNRSSFHRVFKEITGTTPRKLLADTR